MQVARKLTQRIEVATRENGDNAAGWQAHSTARSPQPHSAIEVEPNAAMGYSEDKPDWKSTGPRFVIQLYEV